MKKELVIHFSFLVAFFLLASVFRGWFSLSYIPLWLGGIVGTLLPDVDHLIYVYFLNPHELTSQRVGYLVERKKIVKTMEVLYATRGERLKLVFHTSHFQLIFFALTILVVTSSGSIFGTGLVLAFSLHLLIDQLIDFVEVGNINSWFTKMNLGLDIKQQRWYMIAIGALLLIFGFLL